MHTVQLQMAELQFPQITAAKVFTLEHSVFFCVGLYYSQLKKIDYLSIFSDLKFHKASIDNAIQYGIIIFVSSVAMFNMQRFGKPQYYGICFQKILHESQCSSIFSYCSVAVVIEFPFRYVIVTLLTPGKKFVSLSFRYAL